MLPPDTVLNGRYRLIEPLGEGGMATVYRALDTRLGRTVAVKILHPEYARDRPFLQRFQQEAEFAASLGAHPNIVAIYDIGEDNDRRYIVMEVIEGRNLKEMIRERAPFTVYEAFAIGRQVASALDFAHKRGLVHRDVKPQNILVTPSGVAKVTDFGIARSLTASELTRTGMVIGTVHYFSPEQAQGKPTGPPSDIYALGIILYEMLTGRLPFEADNAIGVAMQHVHNEPPPPCQYNPALPTRPVATIMRALEKDPERRYRDAGEFAAALSEPLGSAKGGTTSFAPIVEPRPETTTVYQPVEPPPPVRRTVMRETKVGPASTIVPPSNPWRSALIALGALLVVALIAGAAFLVAGKAFQANAGTPTPTATATATATSTPHRAKHHRQRPTPTPTAVPVVVSSTNTPLPPPTATSTPKPAPTATPSPTRTPVATPTIQPVTLTIVSITSTPTPTTNG